jgi:hypothetical protein
MFVEISKIMKTNMGKIDRYARILLAVAITISYFSGYIQGGWAVGLIVLAVMFAVTSFIGFCPLYLPFGISTKDKENAKAG